MWKGLSVVGRDVLFQNRGSEGEYVVQQSVIWWGMTCATLDATEEFKQIIL